MNEGELERLRKREEEWEDSSEGIWDRMTLEGDGGLNSQPGRRLLLEVLLRIPKDDREYILERAIFIIPGGDKGAVWHRPYFASGEDQEPEEKTVVLLNMSPDDSEADQKTTIAHELAHLRLDHPSRVDNPENETEADDLCERWGYGRAYPPQLTFPAEDSQ